MISGLNKLGQSLRPFVPASVAFGALFVSLRFYEFEVVKTNLPEEISAGPLEAAAFLYDLVFASRLISWVMIIHVPLSLIRPRVAITISITLFTLLLLFSFGSIQYFSTTLVPLGADLFGYTISDIMTTILSSDGINPSALTMFPLLILLMIVGYILLKNRNPFKQMRPALMVSLVTGLLITWVLPVSPSPEDYDSNIEYFVTTNKSDYFLTQAARFAKERFTEPAAAFQKEDYPLLHTYHYGDSLIQYFTRSPDSLNFVFLIVEGLGRDFTGPGAKYGGFTPFLDSLSEVSLYWENFLSNAGRTFGALPSILGSLPYGRDGFMSQGNDMPDHYTLISLLKPLGYTSNFFYGGNPSFDNQDIFLEYQGFDNTIDKSDFPASYDSDDRSRVSSWGYPDAKMFSFAAQVLKDAGSPRIDVYLTLSTHEPFVVPDKTFETRFEGRLQELDWSKTRSKNARKYNSIFSCLMYTDNALRNLMQYYRSREDFKNTVFIITGDHRLVPLPPDSRIDRFHVPLIVYSPLIKAPHTFSGLAVHSDILPSILSLLTGLYGFEFPDRMPFLSGPISTSTAFSSQLDLALIRYKNGTNDYIEGEYFLSGDRLYRILPDLALRSADDPITKQRLAEKLKAFKARTQYACEENRLAKMAPHSQRELFELTITETTFLGSQHLEELTKEEQFERGRSLAFDGKYFESRSILKSLLNESPNFHDARILLGRTYGWNHEYDSAITYFKQTVKRAPAYADAYSAWCDVEFWRGDNERSLEVVQKGIETDSLNKDLLARKARALMLLNHEGEARRIVSDILKAAPGQDLALKLEHQLNR